MPRAGAAGSEWGAGVMSVSTVATLGWWSVEGSVQPSCFCQ